MAIRKKSSPGKVALNNALEFKKEATDEVVEDARWYRTQAEELDKRCLQCLEHTISIIENNPQTDKKIYKQFRQASLKKFPYVVVYEIEKETIIVYSVFHAKQNPRKKMNRLTKQFYETSI